MFKLPLDVETELQKKYPVINIKLFINDLFETIMTKTLKSKACSIREFGRFVCYKSFSGRINKDQIRFKFTTAGSLSDKVKDDPYLLETLEARPHSIFDKEDEENCKSRKSIKDFNYKAKATALKSEKPSTQNNLARNELERIIQGDL